MKITPEIIRQLLGNALRNEAKGKNLAAVDRLSRHRPMTRQQLKNEIEKHSPKKPHE